MLDVAAARMEEATAKRMLSADRWAHDLAWRASLERLVSVPTVNIEGLVAGYTGPGRQDRPARTAPWPSSTCVSCPT